MTRLKPGWKLFLIQLRKRFSHLKYFYETFGQFSNCSWAAIIEYSAAEIDKAINSMGKRIAMVITTRREDWNTDILVFYQSFFL